MNEIKDDVMSFETAQNPKVQEFLKLIDVKFCYIIKNSEQIKILPTKEAFSLLEINEKLKIYKTLTISEMLEYFPESIFDFYCLFLEKFSNHYFAGYRHIENFNYLNSKKVYPTPLMSLEKLFLWLLEEGYL